MNTKIVIGIIALGALAGGGYFLATKQGAKSTASTDQSPPAATQSETKSEVAKLIIGKASAPITIIQWSDPQCPLCKRFFEQTEPRLKTEYIDTGKAKLEIRIETHLGVDSVRAGEAMYCATDQDKFPAYHDKIYEQQGKAAFTAANLKRFASDLNLDRTKFDSCLDSGKYNAAVKASHEESRSKISGTPTFFIGSQKISGAQPFTVFKTILDAQ